MAELTISAVGLGLQIYTLCQSNAPRYAHLRQEFDSLREALKVQQSVQGDSELGAIWDGCQGVAKDIENILKEYAPVAKGGQNWWYSLLHHIKFKGEDIHDLRWRMISHVLLLLLKRSASPPSSHSDVQQLSSQVCQVLKDYQAPDNQIQAVQTIFLERAAPQRPITPPISPTISPNNASSVRTDVSTPSCTCGGNRAGLSEGSSTKSHTSKVTSILSATKSSLKSRESKFVEAAEIGDLDGLKKNLPRGDKQKITETLNAALVAVSKRRDRLDNQVTVIEMLLRSGASPTYRDPDYQRTPVIWAVIARRDDIVEELIKSEDAKSEAAIKACDRQKGRGWSPLLWALYKGHEDDSIIRQLKERTSTSERTDTSWMRALLWAAEKGHVGFASNILGVSPSLIHVKDENGWTPLALACVNGHTATMRLFLEKGNDPNFEPSGLPLLHWAIIGACPLNETVSLLVEYDVNVQCRDFQCTTALIAAVKRGHLAFVRLFLRKGALLEETDSENLTALMWAVRNGDAEMAQLLIDKGANVDCTDTDGQSSALVTAVKYGHLNVVKVLLQAEIPVDTPDPERRTALLWAVERGDAEAAQLLIDRDASIFGKAADETPAITIAIKKNDIAITKMLMQRAESLNRMGELLNSTDGQGQTPVICAVRDRNEYLTFLLLVFEPDISIRGNDGLTALDHAKDMQEQTIITYLESCSLDRRQPALQ